MFALNLMRYFKNKLPTFADEWTTMLFGFQVIYASDLGLEIGYLGSGF
jgi:hypothetical protein